MSQGIFNNIVPTTTTGLMLAGLLDDFKEAMVSGFSGTSRPANLLAGGMWIDTTFQNAPNYYWSLKVYNGTTDIEILKVSVLTGTSGFSLATGSFTIRKISADTAGAVLNLVKNRIASGGQVLAGDTIAELRLTGRTNTSTDPIVGYIRATAEENYTASERGVILSLASAPVGTSLLVEHMRFIAETVESTAPHKINALIHGVDAVATAASLLMTSDKILSELTGSTASAIHGIEVGVDETRVKLIHNRSTAEATVKHASTVASAAERFSLPEGKDLAILPNGTASFYYCDADSRWKYLSGGVAGLRHFINTFPEGYSEWVAPLTGNVRVVAFQEPSTEPTAATADSRFSRAALLGLLAWGDNGHGQLGIGNTTNKSVPTLVVGDLRLKDAMISGDSSGAVSERGEAYAWGRNQHGQLGLGDVVPRSSPVAVLGGLSFCRVEIGETSYATQFSGQVYGWGRNQHGQAGVGDVASRSSPVAVLGGLKFAAVFHGADGEASAFGVERDTGTLYSWGQNNHGRLGVGDVSSRSSPVAVLGGLKFRKVALGVDCTVGLTESGLAYAWGFNIDGELGVGNVVSRSSPVAVLGGLVFRDVAVMLSGATTSFFGLQDDGTLYAWGANDNGQLGVGDTINRSSPVAVLGGLKFESLARLSAASASVIALQQGTGAAYAWGENSAGQLGVGDIIPRSSPVAVLGGLKFASIVVDDLSAYGQAGDGRFYAWGDNTVGQIGDNTVVSKSSPVLVQGLTEPLFEVPTMKVIPVVAGTTYKIKLCGGISFFGTTNIGKNIRRATVAYEN